MYLDNKNKNLNVPLNPNLLKHQFDVGVEFAKMKVGVTLDELMTIPKCRSQVYKTFQLQEALDISHANDNITLVKNEEPEDDRPLYISLRYDDHDYHYVIHNYMLDLGSKSNLMPKSIADKLGLSYTGSHTSVSKMDNRPMQPVGMIK